MKRIGSYDAKTKLPEMLRCVSAGKSFTITNRGKPVADLVPSQEARKVRSRIAVENILKMERHEVSNADLRKFRESGRR